MSRWAFIALGVVLVPLSALVTASWVLWRLGGVVSVVVALSLVVVTHLVRSALEATP